jgi:hypothetical protein
MRKLTRKRDDLAAEGQESVPYMGNDPDAWNGNKGLEEKDEGEEVNDFYDLNIQLLQSVFVITVVESNIS